MNNRLEQLQLFLKSTPEDPFLRYAIALEHLKLQDETKALALFSELIETNPSYVGTYYHLGKLLEKQEQYDTALSTYEKGINIATQLNDSLSLRELKGAYNMLNDELSDW